MAANFSLIIILAMSDVNLVVDVVWAYVFCQICVVIAGCILLRAYFFDSVVVDVAPSVPYDKLIVMGIPFFVIALADQGMQYASQLIVGALLSPEDVAIFVISMRVGVLCSFVLTAINMAYSPHFAKLFSDGDIAGVLVLLKKSIKYSVILSAPAIFILLFFPGFVLRIFGESYVQGQDILRVIVLGQVVNVITGPVGVLLSMSGHQRSLMWSGLASALVSVGLTFFLVSKYGILGAAVGTALGFIFYSLIASYVVKVIFGFNVMTVFFRT